MEPVKDNPNWVCVPHPAIVFSYFLPICHHCSLKSIIPLFGVLNVLCFHNEDGLDWAQKL